VVGTLMFASTFLAQHRYDFERGARAHEFRKIFSRWGGIPLRCAAWARMPGSHEGKKLSALRRLLPGAAFGIVTNSATSVCWR
jgi:hypothetical protein